MKHIPVVSSNIASLAYEDGTMEVKFKNGGLYRYREVPPEAWNRFISATSPGRHFQSDIRPNFLGVRVTEEAGAEHARHD